MYASVRTSPDAQSWITHGTRPFSSKVISIGTGDSRVGLLQVPREGPPAGPLAAHHGEQRGQRARGQRGDQALQAQRPAEERRVGVREGTVGGEGPFARLA